MGSNQWKRALRAELAGKLNQRLALGELFGRYSGLIPLHEAGRQHAVARPGTPYDSPAAARWYLFKHYLRRLPVEFDPPSRPGVMIRGDAVVIPRGKVCQGCGVICFGELLTRYCSIRCSKLRARVPAWAAALEGRVIQ